MFVPTPSPAGEYLNSLLYHRYDKLFQHSNNNYTMCSSMRQLYLPRRLVLILNTFILYSIITPYLQDLVSVFICYQAVSFEITRISLPPKLYHQILLHTFVAFTESCDVCCNYTIYCCFFFLSSSQSHYYFRKAQHKMQTGLLIVIAMHITTCSSLTAQICAFL